MASTRIALSSVLGTVTSLANSVGSVANTLTTGIESVNDLATDYRSKQQLRIKASMADYSDRLVEEMSEATMLRRARIVEYLDANPKHADLYNEAKAKFEAALAA